MHAYEVRGPIVPIVIQVLGGTSYLFAISVSCINVCCRIAGPPLQNLAVRWVHLGRVACLCHPGGTRYAHD
jgi:hypothetical protein